MKPAATCELWLDGARVPYLPDDLRAGAVTAMSPLTVQWGRDTVLEQPGVGTCSGIIRDPRTSPFRRPLLDTIHVGSDVQVWATGSLVSPGTSPIVDDSSFEGTVEGEFPRSRFDTVVADDSKQLVLDVVGNPGSRTVRVRAEAPLPAPSPDVRPPPPSATFTESTRLVPVDKTRIFQGLTIDQATGDFYTSQIDGSQGMPEDVTLSRFVDGVSTGAPMQIPDAGHLDLLYATRVAGKVHLTFRYKGLSASNEESGTWVRIPWTPGKTWLSAEVLTYRTTAPPRDPLDRRGWLQGEATYNGTYYRVYGGPFNNDGPIDVNMPAFVEVIRDSKITKTIDARMLGRLNMVASNDPINGRLEPEGATAYVDPTSNVPYLIVGIVVGSKGNYQLQTYRYPLAAEPDPAELPEPAPDATRAAVESSQVAVVFPPLPFADPTGLPGQWDAVPQMQPGETWSFSFRVQLPRGDVNRFDGRAVAYAYSSPWQSSRRSSDTITVQTSDVRGILSDGEWHTVSGTMTLSASAGSPAWPAVGFTAPLPSRLAWQGMTGSWLTQPEIWDDFATAYMDDVQMYAPNSTERRVLVFSGKVTDVEAEAVGRAGVDLTFTAADLGAILGNDTIGAPVWPVESLAARVDKIIAAGHTQVDVVVDDAIKTAQLTRRDVDAQPLLGLLQDVATSAGAALWTAMHAITGPYLFLEDLESRKSLKQLTVVGGEIVVQSDGRTGVMSACDVVRDDVRWRQNVDDTITVVEVGWLAQTVDEEGQQTTEDRTETVVDTEPAMLRYGRRVLSVSTELTSATAANQLGAKLLARSRNVAWRADGYRFDTGALANVVSSVPTNARLRTLMDLLDGTARIGLGLNLVDLPEYVPAAEAGSVYVEGGTYTYDGQWSLALNISPAQGQGRGAKWFEVPAAWLWQDFDPELRWADIYGAVVDENPPPSGGGYGSGVYGAGVYGASDGIGTGFGAQPFGKSSFGGTA